MESLEEVASKTTRRDFNGEATGKSGGGLPNTVVNP